MAGDFTPRDEIEAEMDRLERIVAEREWRGRRLAFVGLDGLRGRGHKGAGAIGERTNPPDDLDEIRRSPVSPASRDAVSPVAPSGELADDWRDIDLEADAKTSFDPESPGRRACACAVLPSGRSHAVSTLAPSEAIRSR